MHYRRILAQNYWYYYSHTKWHFNQFHFLTNGTAAPSGPITANCRSLSCCFWLFAAGRRRFKRERVWCDCSFSPEAEMWLHQLVLPASFSVWAASMWQGIKQRSNLYPQLGGYNVTVPSLGDSETKLRESKWLSKGCGTYIYESFLLA